MTEQNDSPGAKSTATESTKSSERCEDEYCRNEILALLSINLKKAYNKYHHASEAAEKDGRTYDGPVFVEIPSTMDEDGWFTAEEIGAVCRNVGPGLRVDAYMQSRQIEIHGCATGFRHGSACVYTNRRIGLVTMDYSDETPVYIRHVSDSTYGVGFISAPDVLLSSVGSSGGNSLEDSPEAPIFVCEIEDHNRSLPALIRHVGALFVNFPNLNAVVGIKGGRSSKQNWAALFMVEKAATTGTLSLTALIDFGPDGLTDLQKTNAQNTFSKPLPPPGQKPTTGTHGLGLGTHFAWNRLLGGVDAAGNDYNHEISPSLLLSGAHTAGGVALTVPAGTEAVRLSLPALLHSFFGA